MKIGVYYEYDPMAVLTDVKAHVEHFIDLPEDRIKYIRDIINKFWEVQREIGERLDDK